MAVTDDLSASQVRTLPNVEDGSEANNISNANVTDLTDSGLATLYYHKLLLPLGTHIDLNPFSATNKYPYSVTIDLSIILVKWTQVV